MQAIVERYSRHGGSWAGSLKPGLAAERLDRDYHNDSPTDIYSRIPRHELSNSDNDYDILECPARVHCGRLEQRLAQQVHGLEVDAQREETRAEQARLPSPVPSSAPPQDGGG